MALQLSPVMVVLGDEELLSSRAVTQIIDAVRDGDPGVEVREFPGNEMMPGDLAEAVSPSLFGGTRVVIIRGGQDLRKEPAAAVTAYAAAPEDDVVLVVTHLGGAKGKALVDALKKAGAAVLPVPRITRSRDRVAFVSEEFRRLGGNATASAAEALVEAVGNDLRDLVAACSQLVADTSGRIDASGVARYYRGRAEVSGFTVADAAMVGDLSGALEGLRWALQTGVDPVPIADALAEGVRSVSRVIGAPKGNQYQLASGLGMPPWKVERAQKQARGWTPQGLAAAMRAAAACNAAVKGGAEDRAYALEKAIFAVVEARGLNP